MREGSSIRVDPSPLRHQIAMASAYGTIWFVWGSTYIAWRVAVQATPPLLVAATRSLLAGALLFALVRLSGVGLRLPWRRARVAGTIYLRHAGLTRAPAQATAMLLLCGGAVATVVAAVAGEIGELGTDALAPGPLGALAYLTVFGSLLGFGAYNWLLGQTSPTRIASYAFVNPIVAVALGWAVAAEVLTARTLSAVVVAVVGVALVVTSSPKRAPQGG